MIDRIKILFFDRPESEREKILSELLKHFEVESIIVFGKEEFSAAISSSETPDIILTGDPEHKSELADLLYKIKKKSESIPILTVSENETPIEDADFSRRAKHIAA